jgi:hypothetical protein
LTYFAYAAMARGLFPHFVNYNHGDMASRNLSFQDLSQVSRARQENSWPLDDRPQGYVQDGSLCNLDNMPQFAYIYTAGQGTPVDMTSANVRDRYPSLPSASAMSVSAPTFPTAVETPSSTAADVVESVAGPPASAVFPDETM